MKPYSKNAMAMPKSRIREIMHIAMEMDDVIHLEVGEPDFQTPEHIVESACIAARSGFTKYTPNAGMLSLREAIVDKVRKYNGIPASVENVTVTASGVCAIATSLMALMDDGDEILIPDLSWPDYDMIIAVNGWTQKRYPLLKDKGFLPDMSALREQITDKTKVIMLNSPSNPTGAVFPKEIQKEFYEVAREYDLYLISDETYDQLVFEGEHVSPAIYDTEGRVISIFSFSKVYAMTGWRVGYIIASPSLSKLIADIQEPYVSCACTVSQKAAESALRGPQNCLKTMIESYKKRRDIAVEILKANNMFVYSPQGTIYMLIDISRSGMNSYDFAMSLLYEKRVAVSPGDTFGQSGKDYIRICFAASEDDLKKGLNRICDHVNKGSAERKDI
ncbi:TPA: aminotransferase class I/II-fold pyridoxal phosphate-dependent enzyme [Candidatus Poribacteria bacterium]|nr:aminotransferase class I/II-fold pyridoxal phosphate-dependent enzyme [Candidatus Poribacteria bacterium]